MVVFANIFDIEGPLGSIPPALAYVSVALDGGDVPRHGTRDRRSHSHGHSTFSGGYDSRNLGHESYGAYGSPQTSGRSGYGGYHNYSIRSDGSSGFSQNHV